MSFSITSFKPRGFKGGQGCCALLKTGTTSGNPRGASNFCSQFFRAEISACAEDVFFGVLPLAVLVCCAAIYVPWLTRHRTNAIRHTCELGDVEQTPHRSAS